MCVTRSKSKKGVFADNRSAEVVPLSTGSSPPRLQPAECWPQHSPYGMCKCGIESNQDTLLEGKRGIVGPVFNMMVSLTVLATLVMFKFEVVDCGSLRFTRFVGHQLERSD